MIDRRIMQKLLDAAGWDAGSIRHKQLEDALDGANLEIVEKRAGTETVCSLCLGTGKVFHENPPRKDTPYSRCHCQAIIR